MTKYLKYLFYPTVFLILNLIVILTVIFNNPSYIDIYIKDYSKTLFKKNYSIDFSYDQIIGTLTNGYYIKNINF